MSSMTAVWAHRGASVARRENTVAAFLEAGRQGADGVELDVRRSRGADLVVHHDAVLADGRPIVDLAGADLPEGVCLLGEALDACGRMTVNVEIKNLEGEPDHDPGEALADAVAALVAERRLHHRVVVSSFSLATIDRVREVDTSIRCGFLASPRSNQAKALLRAAQHGHTAFHPHHLAVNADIVMTAHSLGLAVNTWTVDDPDRMRWLADVGVDAIVTNVPDVARAALAG